MTTIDKADKTNRCPFGRAVMEELETVFHGLRNTEPNSEPRSDTEKTTDPPLPEAVTAARDACVREFKTGIDAEEAGDVETAFVHYRAVKTAFNAFMEALVDYLLEEQAQEEAMSDATR